MAIDGVWTPDLSQIGVDESTLPRGWGWTTLDRNEAMSFGSPLERRPGYGEFIVAPYVTDWEACQHIFRRTRVVVATVSGERIGGDGCRFRHSQLVPWAEVPHWWGFGPQGQAFFDFVACCSSQGERLWGMLRKYPDAKVCWGIDRSVQYEVDKLIDVTRRRGSVARAVHRAGEAFYGYRVDHYYDTYRFVTNSSLALCEGSGLYGTSPYSKTGVSMMDSAVRWLIMRDVLSPEVYRMIAEPWLAVFGWPLHPGDTF